MSAELYQRIQELHRFRDEAVLGANSRFASRIAMAERWLNSNPCQPIPPEIVKLLGMGDDKSRTLLTEAQKDERTDNESRRVAGGNRGHRD
jgi:hypothetical protein